MFRRVCVINPDVRQPDTRVPYRSQDRPRSTADLKDCINFAISKQRSEIRGFVTRTDLAPNKFSFRVLALVMYVEGGNNESF